jgi:hypothetical protein
MVKMDEDQFQLPADSTFQFPQNRSEVSGSQVHEATLPERDATYYCDEVIIQVHDDLVPSSYTSSCFQSTLG